MLEEPREAIVTLSPADGSRDREAVEELLQEAREMVARLQAESHQPDRHVAQQPAVPEPTMPDPAAPAGPLGSDIDVFSVRDRRFLNAPLMSSMARWPEGDPQAGGRASATLSTQDQLALMTFDVETTGGRTEVIFTLRGMLGFRFQLDDLTDDDKEQWLDQVRQKLAAKGEDSDPVFLWSAARAQRDYLVCTVHTTTTRLFAFSSQRYEAAVRISRPVAEELIDWLEMSWFPPISW